MMHRILNGLNSVSPYLAWTVIPVIAAFATSGCTAAGGQSAAQTRSFATTAASTAVGAYIGAKEGEGKGRNAALGAAAGFIVGETINYFSDAAQREAYLAGFEKANSNAIKQQYWIARDNQRSVVDDHYEEVLYEIDVPQADRDGVRREPTKRVIRVVMPKGGRES